MTVDFELASRYRPGTGPVLLTGVQAIARLLVEQHAADAAAGLRTASFVSGYQGSPLGGLDQTLARATELRGRRRPHLGARRSTRSSPRPRSGAARLEVPGHGRTVDGVVGVWYGKGPGVDRASDPMRHGNMCGAHPTGGVLVLVGDDPSCKSSTIPCGQRAHPGRLRVAGAVPRATPRRSSGSAATGSRCRAPPGCGSA